MPWFFLTKDNVDLFNQTKIFLNYSIIYGQKSSSIKITLILSPIESYPQLDVDEHMVLYNTGYMNKIYSQLNNVLMPDCVGRFATPIGNNILFSRDIFKGPRRA